MLRRSLSLFVLFSFFASSLFALDITIPRESWETAKGQAKILSLNLKSKTIELQNLQNLSESQQKQINQLLTDSEKYQSQIEKLLTDSETSEAEYQQIVSEVTGFMDGLNLTIDRLERENKLLKIAIPVAGILGFGLGFYSAKKIFK